MLLMNSDLPRNSHNYSCNPAIFAQDTLIFLIKIEVHCYIVIICYYICIVIVFVNSLMAVTCYVTFEVVTAVKMSVLIFRLVTLYGLVGICQCFG
jgi:hypothetical protein